MIYSMKEDLLVRDILRETGIATYIVGPDLFIEETDVLVCREYMYMSRHDIIEAILLAE